MTLAEHAASIAHDHRDDPDRLTVWRYAKLAAKWSLLRLQRFRKETGDAEERQFAALTPMVRDLTTALGLGTCIDATKTEAKIRNKILCDIDLHPGITTSSGQLPRDPAYILEQTDLAGDRSDVARPLRLAAAVRPVRKCPICGSPRPRRYWMGGSPAIFCRHARVVAKRSGYRAGARDLEALGTNRFHGRAGLRRRCHRRRRRRRGGSSDSHRASVDSACLLLTDRHGSHRADGSQAARDCPSNQQLDPLVPD